MRKIDDFETQRNSLLDFFEPGEFDRMHNTIVVARLHGWRDVRLLNRLLAARALYGEEDCPISECDAERFLELAERAMSVTS